MMWLGIVLHVAINHMVGEFPLPWRDPQISQVANLIFIFIHAFRMPVFFILAGFFVALLVERKDYGGMLKHRLRRVGLPFLIFWPPLYFATGALIDLYVQLMAVDSLGLVSGDVPQRPDQRLLSTMHLWFIYYLLWFCLSAVVCGCLGKYLSVTAKAAFSGFWKRIASAWWGVIVLIGPLVLAGTFYPNGLVNASNSFIPYPGPFVYNGLFFVFGWYLYQHREPLLDLYSRYCWRYFAAGAVFFMISLSLFQSLQSHPENTQSIKIGLGIAYNCTSWLWSFALIGFFLRYLPKQNRFLSYLSESSYWVYLVHMLGTIGFGVLLFNAPLGVPAKMGLNILATTLACIVTYHVLVRYTLVSTLLNGSRHEYKGFLTPGRLGIAVVALVVCFLAFTQVKFSQANVPTRSGPPERIAVPANVGEFLSGLGAAYGGRASADVARYLASDFLHQGMEKAEFLIHLKSNQRYLGKLDIVPIAFDASVKGREGAHLIAYANFTERHTGAIAATAAFARRRNHRHGGRQLEAARQSTAFRDRTQQGNIRHCRRFCTVGYRGLQATYSRRLWHAANAVRAGFRSQFSRCRAAPYALPARSAQHTGHQRYSRNLVCHCFARDRLARCGSRQGSGFSEIYFRHRYQAIIRQSLEGRGMAARQSFGRYCLRSGAGHQIQPIRDAGQRR
jgi:hypothetical protein